MIRVEYSSNNSGGGWWLKDEHWKALEAAGWDVKWERDSNRGWPKGGAWDGERWLGALATHASGEFETPADAIREFEKITGQCASDEGCNCCGPPHCFSWGKGDAYGCASGEEVLAHLFKGEAAKLTKRQLLERGQP